MFTSKITIGSENCKENHSFVCTEYFVERPDSEKSCRFVQMGLVWFEHILLNLFSKGLGTSSQTYFALSLYIF